MIKWLQIILLCVASAVLYGILHDQITVRICLEYFTVGHPPVFPTNNPTLLAIGWGVIASWWVGLILGIFVASSARLGPWPAFEPKNILYPMSVLLISSALLAGIAGLLGYIAARQKILVLLPPLRDAVSPEEHIPFVTALCMHSASYLAGGIGGLVLAGWILFKRIRSSKKSS